MYPLTPYALIMDILQEKYNAMQFLFSFVRIYSQGLLKGVSCRKGLKAQASHKQKRALLAMQSEESEDV